MIDNNKTFRPGKDDPAYRKLAEPNPDFEAEDLLGSLEGIKSTSLKEAIDDLNSMIDERQELSAEIFTDLEKMKVDMSNLIFQLNPETERLEIMNLKKRIFDFDELKVQEKLNNFRDIALLKRELRERQKEFTERESRSGVLDELLNK
ncbi:MAG: hypothetical protein WC471_03840 [Candidatus Woesearchaeota archaeon]|jgi:hypothetical protein